MLYRITTGLQKNQANTIGDKVSRQIFKALNFKVEKVEVYKIFTLEGLSEPQVEKLINEAVLFDPILQRASLNELDLETCQADWIIEVGFRPGVTDNEGRTAKEACALALGLKRQDLSVYTSIQYRLTTSKESPLDQTQVEKLAQEILGNPLIQRFRIKDQKTWKQEAGFSPKAAKVSGTSSASVATIDLASLDDLSLETLSREQTWALNLCELHSIRDAFQTAAEKARRKALNLPENPTDVEMEILAQTWSEHCKHKIFASEIEYLDTASGRRQIFSDLYKTTIRDTTATIRKHLGSLDYCRSVFKDNAGVIQFINGYDACIKVETHNSPSALDPYGGALTGIVGVNRDPMGTGLGAELVANLDVFCFASPFYSEPLPPRLLHPRRVLEGVREGVEHGGNKSGIPTVNGSLVFDQRYLGKPLVYCGTVGILPTEVAGRVGYQKKAEVGDAIVMVGGRIGKDGIHGATFSSEELHEGSPATAVQIGDPITQRKMYDFIIRARDLGLYNAITDNGAGGLSSSVGEMAEDSGGSKLDIAKAPLKYDGLKPWEILLSEAQERMTLAVPPVNREKFLALAKHMDVEATVLGEYTDSGYFEVFYQDKIIASLPMDFMHHGVPQLKLKASWTTPSHKDQRLEVSSLDEGAFLKTMLGRLNICSKEYIVRQYDHEVKGGSAIKPLCGLKQDGPTDAAVFRPVLESDAGLVVSHGICPKFSDYDTYWMMANAMDEAIRNAVCVGGNPQAMAGVDNFCWCDPIVSPKNPDGEYKLAQLVRACQALRHFSLAYNLPCISGKDSMKNDYTHEEKRISIPPTVLFTILGVIPNVICTQTSDFKQPGDHIFILGGTWRELGGSEAYAELGLDSDRVPRVDALSAKVRYETIYNLMLKRSLSAAHDLSDGGLAVALAEMCIGGRLGAKIDLLMVPCLEAMNRQELLYSESASRMLVSCRPEMGVILETFGCWQICRRIGTVTDDGYLTIHSGQSQILREPVEDLAKHFKATLDF
ncbi:MAG: phosphoribosylformylglycinamidine synthase subunit PurS [Desulfovibrionaceae bacterium]|nr:phosphoribosylformylglycinamidine synthase subunit PurS [Desulfovibrionaceae bacterium]